jgi:Pyruvate/2-oxoacid:ferredoxin oxidoreductase delta subunit
MKSKHSSWPRPSTRAFFRAGRHVPGYSFFDWLHGYVYGRWPYLYIGIGTGEHRLAHFLAPLGEKLLRLLMHQPAGTGQTSPSPESDGIAFADTYHGKVVPLEAATHLVTVQEEVNLTNLEQIIPYTRARDIILRNPDHIVALECPCRSVRSNPCLPLDVCLVIGEPFASFVAEHHPHRSRWLSQGEAVEILRAEHERGHVHHAFFKDAMLGRFYAICNCCACCCGAMHAWRNGVPMLAASGYRSQVDADACIGCGDCSNLCQFGALSADDGVAVVDAALCMGCGVCVSHCSQEALSLVRDPGKGEPLEIRELMANAAVSDHSINP